MSGFNFVRLAMAMGIATSGAAAAAGLAWLLSRFVRTDDAKLWHAVSVALAVASLVAPFAALLPPIWRVPLPEAAAPGATVVAIVVAPLAGLVIRIAAGLYLGGTLFLLLSFFAGLRASIRMRRDARPLVASEARRIVAALPEAASLVRIHQRLRLPVTVGWRRAVILLPESWIEWSHDRLVAVLRHEVAHIERRDFVWHSIAALQQAVYWVNPAAWALARRIRLTAELDADRVAAGAAREEYATQLVQAATEAEGLEVEHTVFAPGATHSLATRIDALLAAGGPVPPAHAGARLTAGVLFGAIVIVPMFVQAITIQHANPEAAGLSAIHAERHARHGH